MRFTQLLAWCCGCTGKRCRWSAWQLWGNWAGTGPFHQPVTFTANTDTRFEILSVHLVIQHILFLKLFFFLNCMVLYLKCDSIEMRGNGGREMGNDMQERLPVGLRLGVLLFYILRSLYIERLISMRLVLAGMIKILSRKVIRIRNSRWWCFQQTFTLQSHQCSRSISEYADDHLICISIVVLSLWFTSDVFFWCLLFLHCYVTLICTEHAQWMSLLS